MADVLYVVDGYNVLAYFSRDPSDRSGESRQGHSPHDRWIEADLESMRSLLIERLSDLAGREGADVKLVFDGRPGMGGPSPSVPRVEVIFSKKPHGADEVIERLVNEDSVYDRVIVVTGDYLQQRIVFRGKVLRKPPRELLKMLELDQERDTDGPAAGRRQRYRLGDRVSSEAREALRKLRDQ